MGLKIPTLYNEITSFESYCAQIFPDTPLSRSPTIMPPSPITQRRAKISRQFLTVCERLLVFPSVFLTWETFLLIIPQRCCSHLTRIQFARNGYLMKATARLTGRQSLSLGPFAPIIYILALLVFFAKTYRCITYIRTFC